ncbi:MAG: DUF255 domain-containing protein [Pirellulaceae bacterium]|nr:DUF255 domain-containing protein [Pirellulaceae bacterium]
MTLRFHLVWLTLAFLCGLAVANEPSPTIRWAPDLHAAEAASRQFNVPLLIHFYGDGCLPCRTLEQRVLSRPEIIQTLNKYFICIAINGSQQTQVAASYGVHSWPTDVFVSPDGQPLYQGVCPQDPNSYQRTLENVALMNRDRLALLAEKTSTNNRTAAPTLPSGVPAPQPGLSTLTPMGETRQSGSQAPNYYSATAENQHRAKLATGSTASPQIVSGPTVASLQASSILGPQPAARHPGMSADAQPAGLEGVPFPPLPGLSRSETVHPSTANPSTAFTNAPHVPTVDKTDSASTTGQPGQATRSISAQLVSTPRNTSTESTNPYYQPPAASTLAPSISATSVSPNETEVASSTKAANVNLPQSASGPPALDGYCPVSLKRQQWLPGDMHLAVRHRGRVYLLSSQAAVDAFMQSPDDFIPTLSGNDPMLLLEEGRLSPGSTQHGLFEARTGQVLLFSSAQSKTKFQQDFDRNMQALEAVKTRASAR